MRARKLGLVAICGFCVLAVAAAARGQVRPMAEEVRAVVDEYTYAVARVEVGAVDLKAVHAELMSSLPDGMDEELRKEFQTGLAAGLAVVNGWQEMMKGAGIEEVYLVGSVLDFPYFYAVVPGEVDEGQMDTLVKTMAAGLDVGRGGPTWGRVRGARVVGLAATLERLADREAAARPELAAAWGAAGRGGVQLVLIPPAYVFRATEEMLPVVPVVEAPAQTVTQGARWAALSLELPPETVIELRVQSDNEAAAQKLQPVIVNALRAIRGQIVQEEPRLEGAAWLEDVERMLYPRVEGDGLTLILEEGPVKRVLGEALGQVILEANERAAELKCRNQLKRIGNAIAMYANDHQERYPEELRELETGYGAGEALTCPASREAYVYRGAGLTDMAPANILLAYDREVHPSGVRNVLFTGYTVYPLGPAEFKRAMEQDAKIRKENGLLFEAKGED